MMTALEAVLSAIAGDHGWSESSGNSDAPTGHFARVSIDADTLPAIIESFNDVMDAYGMTDNVNELIGHWLVQTNDVGHVYPTSFDDEPALIAAYDALELEFNKWDDESEDNV